MMDDPRTIHTIAGTGVSGFSGDGGPGENGQIANPFGLAIGPDQALYFCEVDNHRVRRLDARAHTLSTVAGTGRQGYSGDGGPAAAADLNEPYEIRFDTGGNLYIVEMQNHVVRRVDSRSGIISTVAGTGEPGFSGDGGPATAAQLHQPHSIELDGQGALYIADIANHRLRRVDLDRGTIDTVAGNGTQEPTVDGASLAGVSLNGPRTLAFRPPGNLYLALREGNAVYRIDLSQQTIHHVAGTGAFGYTGDGGPALTAELSGPKGIAFSPTGELYLADTESHTIRRVDPDGTITTVVGDGAQHDGPDGDPLSCGLARPHGVLVDDDGVVYVGDSENHRVRRLDPTASE
jgi:DNA-binding beta-propeller fold protein YncE